MSSKSVSSDVNISSCISYYDNITSGENIRSSTRSFIISDSSNNNISSNISTGFIICSIINGSIISNSSILVVILVL